MQAVRVSVACHFTLHHCSELLATLQAVLEQVIVCSEVKASQLAVA